MSTEFPQDSMAKPGDYEPPADKWERERLEAENARLARENQELREAAEEALDELGLLPAKSQLGQRHAEQARRILRRVLGAEDAT